MKKKLTNLVQLLNAVEFDLNEHKNPHFTITMLTFEGDPSVTYKINTKILRMALRLARRHYVKNRKKDEFYPPGMHPAEIRERAMKEKRYASEADYTPPGVKTVTYYDEPERSRIVKYAEELERKKRKVPLQKESPGANELKEKLFHAAEPDCLKKAAE